VGIFDCFDLFAFYIQPEVLLTTHSAKFGKNNKVFKLGFTQLSIPAMVGRSLFRVFRAQIGPVLSLFLSAKEEEKM